jgi:hypothetical protein
MVAFAQSEVDRARVMPRSPRSCIQELGIQVAVVGIADETEFRRAVAAGAVGAVGEGMTP